MVESIKAWGADKYKQWQDMDAIFRWLMIIIVLVFVPMIVAAHYRKPPTKSLVSSLKGSSASASETSGPQDAALPGAVAPGGWGGQRVLPDSPRNQGLESVTARQDAMDSKLAAISAQLTAMSSQGSKPLGFGAQMQRTSLPASSPTATPAANSSPSSNGLGKDLPEQVSFDQPGSRASGDKVADATAGASDAAGQPSPPPMPSRPMMVSDPIDKGAQSGDDGRPDLVLPMYTGMEAVMLSGVNARPSGSNAGSNGGAAGSVTSALDVGAPFVSRIKGVAIMPNSWKAADLENCFVGGSATAVLSAERAYAIADHISCVFKNGDVYEAPVKAYALDVDGTLGLAGKVVNKQGAMLMQAALTGMAAGLGAALAPTAVPSYNTNTGSGSEQSFTVPSPSYLAGTAVGQGINHAATELSQFYLNFAKETFPVVEVTAGTRVTWILEKDITLKKRTKDATS